MLGEKIKKSPLKTELMGKIGIIVLIHFSASLVFNIFWLTEHEKQKVEQEFVYLKNHIDSSLNEAIWQEKNESIQTKIDIVDNFKYIKYIEIIKRNEPIASSGDNIASEAAISKHYPLNIKSSNQQPEIGDLNIVADTSNLLTNAISSGHLLLLEKLLVFSIILFSLYSLLNRSLFSHLKKLALFAAKPDYEATKPGLNSKAIANRYNELDIITNAIVTQNKEVERKNHALEFSEDKFYKIFNSSPDAILITRFDNGKLITVNKSFYRLYEFEVSDNIIGKTAIELNLWSSTEDREAWKRRLQEEGEIFLRETKYQKKSGNTSDCVVSMQLIELDDFLCVMSTVRDISQTKKYHEKLIHSQQRLQNLSKHQEAIRENERIGIAREVHDELGQSFTSLKIDLCWLRDTLPENSVTSEKLSNMISNIDSSVDTVRRISSQLRPSVLDDLGLEAAIEWYAQEFTKRTAIEHKLIIDCDDLDPLQHRDIAIFRIFQEALTNIARHSQATHFRVEMQMIHNNIELIIQDNGIGITNKQLESLNSIGIIGMQERATNINAKISIHNLKQGGAEVKLTCPIEELKKDLDIHND